MNVNVAEVMGPPVDRYKGVVNFNGILIGLEHVAGNLHPISGKRVDVSYGDVPGSQGVDGDPVDVLLGSDWTSQLVFVLQDAHVTDTDNPGDPAQYGEDKIALRFPSEGAARAAHAAYYAGDRRKIVGCIVSTLEDLRERINCPAEAGMPWFAKSVIGDTIDPLTKSQKPPPGFHPVPKSKHGGFRKPRGGGKKGYQYWYPDQHHHSHAEHGWEEHYAAGKGTGEAQAGRFFRIEGEQGIYVYAPDAADTAPEGSAPFVKYDPTTGHGEGEVVFAKEDRVVRLKAKAKPKPKPKPRPRPTTPRPTKRRKKKPKAGGGGPARPTIPIGRGPRPLVEGEDQRKRTRVFKHSRAAEGTYLHRLENGHYPVIKVKDSHYTHGRMTEAVHVPKADQAAMLDEFKDLICGAADRVAATYRVKRGTEDWREINSGASLGFVMALRSYNGGRPFIPHAQDFVNTYATRAGHSSLAGGSAHVPRRAMQLVHGMIAARNRARTREGQEPTEAQIVRHWRCRKKDIFNSERKLGNYVAADGETIVDQDKEELPDSDWYIRTPTGEEDGDAKPGKASMVRRMRPMLDGAKVHGSEWMEQHDEGLIGGSRIDSGMSVGTSLHSQSQVANVLADMKTEDALTISVLFGLDNDYTEGLDRTSRKQTGWRGADLKDSELADILQLTDRDATKATKQKAGERARRRAVDMFKLTAQRQNTAHGVRRVVGALTRPAPEFKDFEGESHNQMMERFGTDERVRLYRVGLRSGDKDRVGAILDRDVKGKATEDEMEDLRQAYYTQRAADRIHAFRMQTAHRTVAPETASDPGAGSDPESDWLYADEILHNAMEAAVSGRVRVQRDTDNEPAPRASRSRVMSEERFARFMGRPYPPPNAASPDEE